MIKTAHLKAQVPFLCVLNGSFLMTIKVAGELMLFLHQRIIINDKANNLC